MEWVNSTRSKKLTSPLLPINLFFLTFYLRNKSKGNGQNTTEWSKELLNYNEEIKGKVLLEMFIKQVFVFIFRSLILIVLSILFVSLPFFVFLFFLAQSREAGYTAPESRRTSTV